MAKSLEQAFWKCLFAILLLVHVKGHSSDEEIGSPFNYGENDDLESPLFLMTGQLAELQRQRRQVNASPPTTIGNLTTATPSPSQSPSISTVGSNQSSTPTASPVATNLSTPTPQPNTSQPTTRTPVPVTASPTGTTFLPRSTDPDIIVHDRKYYTIQTTQTHYDRYWVDLNTDGAIHRTLSQGHRLAQTVKLQFAFSFYGHTVRNVTIATGGFLYMSPFLHKFLTATQYIAPLMANFDTSVGNESNIRYLSNNEMLVVQWENVHLKDQVESGRFNFQVHLKRTGSIYFVYKDVPVIVSKILEENHPVKVGLSDAFYIDKDDERLGMKRRTIYEYHRVTVNTTQITSKTAILIEPKQTCNMATTCDSCLNLDKSLDCSWCGIVQRCSDGVDWYRQHWLDQGCKYLSGKENCSTIPNVSPAKYTTKKGDKVNGTICTGVPCTTQPTSKGIVTVQSIDCNKLGINCNPSPTARRFKTKAQGNSDGFPVGAIIAIIFIITLVVGIGGWFFYAYTHPTTTSGMWLMEHRPTAMKTKLAKMKFWKQSTPSGDKYAVESEA